MKRYSFILIVLTLVLTLSIGFICCTREESIEQIEYIELSMAELENAVLLKHFNTTPTSMEISNKDYFTTAVGLKTSVIETERNIIKSTLCKYDLSTSKFSDQKKTDNVQLTGMEQVIYESFLTSFNNSDDSFIAICEFYINEVSCLDINNKIKADFANRIGFFKDLLIYVDYETNLDQLSYATVLKSTEKIPFDDCYDDCMTEEIEHATSSTIRKVIFLLSLPVRAAEFMIICVGECI